MEAPDIRFAKTYVKKFYFWLTMSGTLGLLIGYFLLIGSPFFINKAKPLGRYLSYLGTLLLGSYTVLISKESRDEKDVFKIVFSSERESHIDQVAANFIQEKQQLRQVTDPPDVPPARTENELPGTALELQLQQLSEEYGTDPNSLGLALVQASSGVSKTEILKGTLNMSGSKWEKGTELLAKLKEIEM